MPDLNFAGAFPFNYLLQLSWVHVIDTNSTRTLLSYCKFLIIDIAG